FRPISLSAFMLTSPMILRSPSTFSPCSLPRVQSHLFAHSVPPKPRRPKFSSSTPASSQATTRSSFPVWRLPTRISLPRKNSPGFSLRLKYDTSLGHDKSLRRKNSLRFKGVPSHGFRSSRFLSAALFLL